MNQPNDTAQVLIVGDGLIGASIAYHCAKSGLDVLLLDGGELGITATAQAVGTVRTYFPGKPHDSQLVVHSLNEFRSFRDMLGVDPGFATDVGFLTVMTTDEQTPALGQEMAVQQAAGVELELLDAAEAVAKNPWLDRRTIKSAIWCPETFRVMPHAIVRGYAEGARAHGAQVLTNVAVTSISEDGRVTTSCGEFEAQTIVIAAGPATRDVAALTGLRLPVWNQFGELMHTGPIVAEGEIDTPFTFHPESGLKTMGSGRGLLVGLERISDKEGMQKIWFDEAVTELNLRYSRLNNAGLSSVWTGALDVTATTSAIIGRAEGHHDRILFAAGFGGHGLGQAPVVGQIVRDLCTGTQSEFDLTPYSLCAPAHRSN